MNPINLRPQGREALARLLIVPATALLLAFPPEIQAQNVVKFRLKVEPDQVSAGGEIQAVLNARLEDGWHLYSMTQPPGGPVPTSIAVEENPVFGPGGAIQQPPVQTWFDNNFGIETEYFEGDVDFKIPIKINVSAVPGTHSLPVKITFMVCSDKLCLPPQTKHLTAEVQVLSPPVGDVQASKTQSPKTAPEVAQPALLESKTESVSPAPTAAGVSDTSGLPSPQSPLPISTLAYVWFAMAMGGLALLTPCVFPMIPITVSYFTQRGVSRKQALFEAALYSFGIILTFTLIGFALTYLLGAGGINRLAASPLVNVAIALIFIVFALSLFGVMEIRLPSSWINAFNRRSGGGNVTGIMFMALTFSLTSFTCTVPFVGTVMVAAIQGDWLWSLLGVLAFATVFSAPFFLLAWFPSWLQALPKSGNWMNSVKITMGFLELAAALKFISNVDLVYQWEIVTRPVFITLWLAIALVTALYLLGKFSLPHETPATSVGAGRVLSAIFFLAVSFYLLRGLVGLPLGELDAFLPPRDYGNPASMSWRSDEASGASQEIWLTNYEAALSRARAENRPLFIDFTGYTCTNCRWMESNIFVLPEVQTLFRQFVLVRLYTDGREPEHEENLRFEQTRFGTIALPLYAIISPGDEIIATFPGLTRNKHEFLEFLRKGLDKGPAPEKQASWELQESR